MFEDVILYSRYNFGCLWVSAHPMYHCDLDPQRVIVASQGSGWSSSFSGKDWENQIGNFKSDEEAFAWLLEA
jgi:hypothetical protein